MRLASVSLVIITLCCCLGWQGPAQAGFNPGEMLKRQNLPFTLAVWSLGSLGFTSIAYYMYKNSPAQRAQGYPEEMGPGEWYVGAYTGLSYLPPADWRFAPDFPAPYGGRTAQDIHYQPGILGGIKFGHYFNAHPWFGMEVETSFSRNNLRSNQGRIAPPVAGGPPNLMVGSDWFMTWALQANLLARYGFLKDKEVTFGRLQPYVGIGPGFEIIYAKWDSAKNFGLETLVGLRYMCTPKISIFCEYKFSYQFSAEYQNYRLVKSGPGGFQESGTLSFDVPHHRFIIGVAYHFKNLYGN
jgi:opacity protein-like surface antigen